MKLKKFIFRRTPTLPEIAALAGSVPPGRCTITIIDDPPVFMTENGFRFNTNSPKRRRNSTNHSYKFNRARRRKA